MTDTAKAAPKATPKRRTATPLQPAPHSGFAAGTLVHTRDGLKPIEQIQVGDGVLSKPESGEGEREYKRVTQTFVHEDRQVLYIGVAIVTDAREIRKHEYIAVTPEHPIWVKGKGWKPAEKLKFQNPLELASGENGGVGSNRRLITTNQPGVAWLQFGGTAATLAGKGSKIDIRTLQKVEEEVFVEIDFIRNTCRVKPEHLFRTTVYNLEVEDFHTYYVTETGIWVAGSVGLPVVHAGG